MSSIHVMSLPRVSIPSYLSTFETEADEIHLIFAKKPSLPSCNENFNISPVKQTFSYESEETIEECDLTGDPLKTDLGENDDTIQLVKMEDINHSWSNDESKHYPLSVRDARRILNQSLRKPKNCDTENHLPIYIVSNGDDSSRTFILGADKKKLMSCAVYILGYLKISDTLVELDKMVKDHLNNANSKKVEIHYLVKMKYNIYGKPLKNLLNRNTSVRKLERHANVSVDVTCNKCVFQDLQNDAAMKMNLEIISGHKLLTLNFLWEELYILQTYLNILSDSDLFTNEETILSKTPLDRDEILRTISNQVTMRFLRPEVDKEVDLKHLREGNLLDGLWNVLKNCENISVLRNSFHFLFEELAESNIRSMPIKDDTSNIASIINGILNGKLLLSTITLPQAVDLLFELGAQKLKNDFQVILNQFSMTMNSKIVSVWNDISKKSQSFGENTRNTRVTHNIKSIKLDMKIKQLAYLTQLYLGSEFIYLVKEHVNLLGDTFYHFCECIEKQYVEAPKTVVDFFEVYQRPLCEISFELGLKNFQVVTSLYPSRWTMYMNSLVGSSQITTIYDLSESPIFPPMIYEYDVPVITDNNMVYYVSKMIRRNGFF